MVNYSSADLNATKLPASSQDGRRDHFLEFSPDPGRAPPPQIHPCKTRTRQFGCVGRSFSQPFKLVGLYDVDTRGSAKATSGIKGKSDLWHDFQIGNSGCCCLLPVNDPFNKVELGHFNSSLQPSLLDNSHPLPDNKTTCRASETTEAAPFAICTRVMCGVS